jgi:urease accessory protein
MPIAAVLVGLFAIFHGHAHGTELPEAANPIAYAVGFVIATGLLHLLGILFGTLMASGTGKMAVRAGGAVIALVGAAFLVGIA